MREVGELFFIFIGVMTVVALIMIALLSLNQYRPWNKLKIKVSCFFNKHTPGPIYVSVGECHIRRCVYCDRVTKTKLIELHENGERNGTRN